ncbi:restriction endonuclease subunit S [Sphingobium yanoikuyae]|uniref:Type I restriction endonuclease subunit S n=1 Tax=Sphingobium yanoikuyae TaxID=13690 RepID=A0A3G2USH2_SPHYA|nr:restriction endonuclease subunit S [Sphingobium yanoikuyae]AYO78200.1 type I restriction endonuclease subunit S [Sphingobium yanoikuyae]
MSHLPIGWAETCIDDIAEVNPGRLGHIATDAQISFVPMPAVSDIDGEIVSPTIRPYGEVSKGYTQFRDGDVIFAKITPCMENGKIAVARALEGGMACGSTEFHVVRPSSDISPDYLWRYLRQKSFRNDAEASMTGAVGQRRVPANFLKEHRLNLPPLPEQQRIVATIDSLTGKSKRARDHLDHIPRLVEKYKQAILAAAFRGDLTREWRETRGEGPWRDVSVSDLSLSLFDGPFGSNLKSSDYTEQGIRVVRLENIGHLGFIREKQTFVSEEKYAGLTRHTLQSNDILVSSFVADEMRVCLFPHDLDTLAINKADCFCIRPDISAVIPKFVELRLASSETYKALEEAVHGATRPRISLTQLRSFRFDLPSMEEQTEIVHRIESAFAWIDRLAADSTSARKLIDHLDQSVLAKAFKGELVQQDPADEPASALLDRIRAERAATPKAKRGRKKAD